MSKKVEAILGCTEQQTNLVISRSEGVRDGITLNGHYPTPIPDMATFGGAITTAISARTKWGSRNHHGSTQDEIDFKLSIKTLFAYLKQERNYVNLTTPNDEDALATSGFPLSNQPDKKDLLEPPRNVRRMMDKNLGLHQVKVKCKKPANAAKGQKVTYKYYRSFNPNFASASMIATVTKTSYIDIPAMPNNQPGTVYYWVAAVSPAGESNPGDVLQVSVVPQVV